MLVHASEKDKERVYTNCLMMHNLLLSDLIEIVYEEMSKIKLYMKLQVVMSYSTEVTGWFIKLHSEIDINHIQQFFYPRS